MDVYKQTADEWRRIYDAKRDLRVALVDKGVYIPDGVTIDQYADIIRSSMSETVQIYKSEMFTRCPQERLPNFMISPLYNPADMSFMFSQCANLVELPRVSGVERVNTMRYYASGSGLIRGIVDIPSLPMCHSLECSFEDCKSVEVIVIGDVPKCTTLRNFAIGCKLAKSIKLGHMPEVMYLGQSFLACNVVTRIDTSFGAKIIDMSRTFGGCYALKEISGVIDVTNVSDFNDTFDDCRELNEVRLKGVKANIDLSRSPKISIESLRYLVTNAQVVTAKTIFLPRRIFDEHRDEMEALGRDATAKGFTINYQ